MTKKGLIERAERWETSKMPILGYPTQGQKEILKISTNIIKALCEMDDLTPNKATQALKMAADIIDEESKNDAIV